MLAQLRNFTQCNLIHSKLLFIMLLFIFLIISGTNAQDGNTDIGLTELQNRLINYDSLALSEVMVFGTTHFGNEILAEDTQKEIEKLIDALTKYNPTKIVVEWEPEKFEAANKDYHAYLNRMFDISQKPNEVYQIGFRLAQKMNHDSIYLFDNKTEFIGSLEDFSFKSFSDYAKKEDDGFYNKNEALLIHTFEKNASLLNSVPLYNRLTLMNSPEFQKINSQRMHMYEVRVGIQKNWLGPDWLGRWYRRNVRMMSNVLKMNEQGDKILIIVGDNHKWTLDMLFENAPEFKVKSSWELLKHNEH